MRILSIFLTVAAIGIFADDEVSYNVTNGRDEEAYIFNHRLFFRVNRTSEPIEVDPNQANYFWQGFLGFYNDFHYGYWWSDDSNYLVYVSFDMRLVKNVSWNLYKDKQSYPEVVQQPYWKPFEDIPPYTISIWNLKTQTVKRIPFEKFKNHNGSLYFVKEITTYEIDDDKQKFLIRLNNKFWNELVFVSCDFETAECQLLFEYKFSPKLYISYMFYSCQIHQNRYYLLLPLEFENEGNSYQQIASYPLNEPSSEPRFEMRQPYDVYKFKINDTTVTFNAFSRTPFINDTLEMQLGSNEKPRCVKCPKLYSNDFLHFGKVPLGNGYEGLYKLFLPKNIKNKKVPLHVYVYGGPEFFEVESKENDNDENEINFLTRNNQVARLYIDGRGSGRRGWKYRSAIYGRLGTVDAQDQISVTQYILRKYSDILDERRVLVEGWSYGGVMALSIVEQAPKGLFKCAIAGAPVTNYNYYHIEYTLTYMGNATANEYLDLTDNLENFKSTRLLLQHGMADDNVHFQNSAILIEKLHKAKIDFDLMIYPNSDHKISITRKQFNFENNCLGIYPSY
ncbi:unnamed protein product [Caenorhabditis angaria]|uniref:Peptidase S9 prolyl oligopeptidase catalytic domain-containing protein n=1 Tax=Caenorhabditis angaria TaxID=860376 RepID=A0A9P1J344_9PELO|nr:unnamed protein product [Caenorhabditis angaria]